MALSNTSWTGSSSCSRSNDPSADLTWSMACCTGASVSCGASAWILHGDLLELGVDLVEILARMMVVERLQQLFELRLHGRERVLEVAAQLEFAVGPDLEERFNLASRPPRDRPRGPGRARRRGPPSSNRAGDSSGTCETMSAAVPIADAAVSKYGFIWACWSRPTNSFTLSVIVETI